MFDLSSSLLAALTGFVSGLLASIPVGPVNVTIINQGARRGFAWALLIGTGAVCMEVIYCTVAFTGLASFFTRGIVKAAMELTSFVFILYLGWRFLTARAVDVSSRVEERLEGRFQPHSAFMTGFVRVMGNPGVLLFWIFMAANFISHEWVEPTWPGKLSCIAGVACGIGFWFLFLSYAVSLGHKKFTEKTLLRMEQASGVGLILFAIGNGIYIVHQMHH